MTGKTLIAAIVGAVLVSGCAAVGFNPPDSHEISNEEGNRRVEERHYPPNGPDFQGETIYPFTTTGEMVCKDVPKEFIAQLETIAMVGGAIRLTEGKMINTEENRWEVAIDTWVDPHSDGHSREDHDLRWYFDVRLDGEALTGKRAGYAQYADKCFSD